MSRPFEGVRSSASANPLPCSGVRCELGLGESDFGYEIAAAPPGAAVAKPLSSTENVSNSLATVATYSAAIAAG
jgi:hypothetical protein